MAKTPQLRNRQRQPSPAEPSATELEQFHLVFFLREAIERKLVENIQVMLEEKIGATPPDRVALALWIDSPGGDAHAAFKLYRELRSRCARLHAVVPDFAKSAATLLAIGCDHIFASPAADFGPLDAQIDHPDREGETVSALAGANAAEHLARLGVNLALTTGKSISDLSGLPRAEVIKQGLSYSADILRPVMSKLDPQMVHSAGEQLKVTRQYAEIVLQSHVSPLPLAQITEISRKLVTGYPTHGYVIDLQELKRLGIPCSPLSSHPLAGRIKNLHQSFSRSSKSLTKLLNLKGDAM